MSASPLRRSLPAEHDAAAVARRTLEGIKGYLEVDLWERSALVVTELVTNSVKHAGLAVGGGIGLMIVMLPACLRIEVTDGGTGFKPAIAKQGNAQRDGGWGLLLVDQLSDRWGVELGHSTRVWCEFDFARARLGEGLQEEDLELEVGPDVVS